LKLKKLMFGLVCVLASTTAAPVMAQTNAAPAQQQAAKPGYADQVVCETQEETGSRLASHKICHTRSQWAQIHQDQRDEVDHTQAQRSMDNNGH
jgi:hypothetical protein